MKRIITLVLSLIIMTSATAQSVVLDPTRLATETSNFLESFKALLEKGAIAFDKLESVQKVLDNIEDVKKQVEVVSDYIGKGKKMQEIISYSESSIRQMMRMKDEIQNDPYMPISDKIKYIEDLMDRTTRISNMVADAVEMFSSGNKESGNMNDAERDDLQNEVLEELAFEEFLMELKTQNRKNKALLNEFRNSCEKRSYNAMMFNF